MSIRVIAEVLDHSPQKGSGRLVLIALASYADEQGFCYPSVQSIAKKANVSEATAHVAIRKLVADRELAIEANAGRAGTNRYRVLVGVGEQLALLGGPVFGGSESWTGPRTGPVSRSTPESSSPVVDLSGTGTDGQGLESGPVQNLDPLAIVKRARRLWSDERRKAGQKRWTDTAGLNRLAEQVAVAVAAGAHWADVEPALRAKAADPKASPWYADEWILERTGARLEQEHRRRAERERREAQEQHDARAKAEWAALEKQHPGLSRRQIRELIAPPPGGVRRAS